MSIELTPGKPQNAGAETAGPAAMISSAPAELPSHAPERDRHHRRLPTHFVVGTLLLYALVLGTFMLTATRLRHAEPNWRQLVPFAAGVSYYVASTLFLLILGRGRVSRWTVLACIACTLAATTLLCLALRAGLLVEQVPPDAHALRALLVRTNAAVNAVFAGDGWLAQTLEFAGMITVEELIKLLPVFALIATGRIRTAHGAMLCGALGGLTFGAVEAIGFGYLVYPADGSPVSTYFTRFFIMSPMHGIWDALAGGLVFFLGGGSGGGGGGGDTGGLWDATVGSAAAAFSCAVVFHVAHNALQAIVGPVMQIVTVFVLLAPLYHMAKAARRRAAAEGSPDRGQLVGDLHLLTFSLSVGFLAISILFSWVLGLHRP